MRDKENKKDGMQISSFLIFESENKKLENYKRRGERMMENGKVLREKICAFAKHLSREERSEATIEKYVSPRLRAG